MPKGRLRLIHWNSIEALEKIALLKGAGFLVEYDTFSPGVLRTMGQDPPNAVLIDLGRLPSQGRDVGVQVRMHRSTRLVPLIFIGGRTEKTASIRALIPDAFYTTWDDIFPTLELALAQPPTEVVVPGSVFAAYAGTPLVKKLGIKENAIVVVLDPPDGSPESINNLPMGVSFIDQLTPGCDLVIWFVRSLAALEAKIDQISERICKEGLWIVWPKKTSKLAADITENQVRQAGLARGLVDYKIISLDETWSGLRFNRRAKSSKGLNQ